MKKLIKTFSSIQSNAIRFRSKSETSLYHKFLQVCVFLYLTLDICLCGTSTAFSINGDIDTGMNLHNESSVYITFITHDITLSVGEEKNITYCINSSLVEDEIVIHFNFSGKNLLGDIPVILVPKNQSDICSNFSIIAKAKGETVLFARAIPSNMTDTSNAFVRLAIHYSGSLDYLSNIVGWMYFTAWSVSFYPQTILNWRRKSVIGLHFDFLALNTVGFLLYSIFNIGLYWIHSVEKEYFKRHPYGINPIQLNDVIFSLHALFACFIQILQCIIYERGSQKMSRTGRSILGGLVILSIICLILGSTTAIAWLDFLYILSYIKLFITLIKYIPQAYFNYIRKSTSGWSIGNIILDFTGGSLSIFQMFIISYNYNDWGSLVGDPAKFGLGLFSILFDIFFMVQHYVLYKGYEAYQLIPESPALSSLSHQDTSESNQGISYGSVSVDVH